jgi:hypothetical protein
MRQRSRAMKRATMAALVCLAAAWNTTVLGNDRPYLATNTAAAEEDDAGVWSVEVVAAQTGSLRSLNVAPEYAFNPTTSMQLELGGVRSRDGGESVVVAELEFKHLFNHIARDGYGWSLALALGTARESGASWKRDEWESALAVLTGLVGKRGPFAPERRCHQAS